MHHEGATTHVKQERRVLLVDNKRVTIIDQGRKLRPVHSSLDFHYQPGNLTPGHSTTKDEHRMEIHLEVDRRYTLLSKSIRQ